MFISKFLAVVSVYTGFSAYEKIPDIQQYNQSYIISVPGVIQTDDHSCGFWTLFNAKGLQRCIEETGSIDVQLIQRYAKEYERDINNELLPSDLMQQFSQSLVGLENLDVITRQPGTGQVILEKTNNRYLEILSNPEIGEEELEEQIFNFQSNLSAELTNKLVVIKNNLLHDPDNNKMHHFACLLNGHWVLMTMLKLTNRNAIDIVYMDSLDKPIKLNRARRYYLELFKRHFLNN